MIPYSRVIKMKGKSDAVAEVKIKEILSAPDELSIKGTTYYMADDGDDNNDGLSPDTPWRSFEKLASFRKELRSGDAVLFKRGSVFRQNDIKHPNLNDNAAIIAVDGVSYGAYGTGPKPALYGSPRNFAEDNVWVKSERYDVWQTRLPLQDAGIVVFDEGKYTGVKKCALDQVKTERDFYHDTENGILYLLSGRGCPSDVYDSIEIGVDRPIFLFCSYVSNVVLDNFCIKYVGGHAISGYEHNNNIDITNCEIGWIGGSMQNPTVRYGNAIQFYLHNANLKVENNWIYQAYDAGITFQCCRPEVTYKDISFSYNVIDYCNYAIEWWSRGLDAEIDGIYFDGNIMRFSGYGWGRQRPDQHTSCHIYGSGSKNYTHLGEVFVRDNIFDSAYSQVIWWGWNTQGSQPDWVLKNNTYYQGLTADEYVFRFGPSEDGGGKRIYALNEQEFKNAVAQRDSSPKLVEWLDN